MKFYCASGRLISHLGRTLEGASANVKAGEKHAENGAGLMMAISSANGHQFNTIRAAWALICLHSTLISFRYITNCTTWLVKQDIIDWYGLS